MADSMMAGHLPPGPAHKALAHNMLLAAGTLAPNSKSLFDRLFIMGEPDAVVARDLKLTDAELIVRRGNLLRTLMAATTPKLG